MRVLAALAVLFVVFTFSACDKPSSAPEPTQPSVTGTQSRPGVEVHAPNVDVKTGSTGTTVHAPGADVHVEKKPAE